MFLSKIGCKLTKHLVTNRMSAKQALSSPVFLASWNSVCCRRFSDGKNDNTVKSDKYKVFKDDECSIVLDVEEERAILDSQDSDHLDFEEIDQFSGLNKSR